MSFRKFLNLLRVFSSINGNVPLPGLNMESVLLGMAISNISLSSNEEGAGDTLFNQNISQPLSDQSDHIIPNNNAIELVSEEDDSEENQTSDTNEEQQDSQGEPKKKSKTKLLIDNLNSVGGSKKSIVEKLTAIEKAMEFLQRELREHEGSINEIDFGIPQGRCAISGSEDDNLSQVHWIDQGHGLLAFIQKCLRNSVRYSNVIRWTNQRNLEFKIVDPERFAKMWGTEKRKEGMTKRKLTRSLAYLVNNKGHLKRSASRNFVYTIVPTSRDGNKNSPTPSETSSPLPPSTPSTPTTPQQPTSKGISTEKLQQLFQENPHYRNIYLRLKAGLAMQERKQQQMLATPGIPTLGMSTQNSNIGTKRTYHQNNMADATLSPKMPRTATASPMLEQSTEPMPALPPTRPPILQPPTYQLPNYWWDDVVHDNSSTNPFSPVTGTPSLPCSSELPSDVEDLIITQTDPYNFTALYQSQSHHETDDIVQQINPTFSLTGTTNGLTDSNPLCNGIRDLASIYL